MKKNPSLTPLFVIILLCIFSFGPFMYPFAGGVVGSWTAASNGLPTSGTFFGVAFGDINNDGDLDIVAASDGNGLRVFLGDGTGSWEAAASHPAESGGFGDVALGDYDSDGNLDIFAGSPGNSASSPTGLHVYKGDGTGGFTDVTASSTLPSEGKWRGVAVGDVNSDGNLDLAATAGYNTKEGIHVFLGDGAGTFIDNSSGLPTDQDRGSKVVLADFNSDGKLDVAAGGSPGVSVYLGDGGSGGEMTWFASSSGLPSDRYTGIEPADVDNDGLLDLVLASYDAGSGVGLRAYRNVNNAASWQSLSSGLPVSGDYIESSTGDLDGDGNIDIVTGGIYGTYGIKIYWGDGSGLWTENSGDLPSTNERVGNDVGDIDGDGKPDILFGRYGGGGLEVWKNLGDGPLPPEVSSTSPNNGATNVPLNSVISITFSRVMNTIVTEAVITSSPTISWSSAWTTQDTLVTFTPSANLDQNSQYSIIVGIEAESTEGLNLESAYTFSFTTGSLEDITSPTLVSTDPESDAIDVDSQTTITITFNEPMDLAVTESAVSISHGAIIEKTWNADGTELSLTVSLEYTTTYTVTISDNAQDLAGNKISSGHSFSFTTESKAESDGDGFEFSTMNILLLLFVMIIVIILLYLILLKGKKKV
ncbi:MAG: VCBS repeat-containing protein [Thermoplasmata archaeon]|nr:MAG: VCBS repeat-containing protein [Thermoplasmata archaeon]